MDDELKLDTKSEAFPLQLYGAVEPEAEPWRFPVNSR